MSRHIQDPSRPFPTQGGLFGAPGIGPYTFDPFPTFHRSMVELIDRVRGMNSGKLGLDLEYHVVSRRPFILGVAGMDWAVGIPWNKNAAWVVYEAASRGVQLVAHNGINADKPIFDAALGVNTPLTWWIDSQIKTYLANQDFCKGTSKDEEEEAGSFGLYNLWTTASIYTDSYNWKSCRGLSCSGPCPVHSPHHYCAIDAWAGLAANEAIDRDFARKGIPDSLYTHVSELAELCRLMEEKGIAIDMDVVHQLEKSHAEQQTKLFPFENVGRKKVYLGPFNPNSSDQIIEYFANQKIKLDSTDKREIFKKLKAEAKKFGWVDIDQLADCDDDELSEGLQNLYKLHLYKSGGKGVSSWVDPKYFGPDGYIHGRFIPTGTSTGRLASSRPNQQNWAKKSGIRRAVVPRHKDLTFLEADYSNLEGRIVLWYSKYPKPVDDKLFEHLVASAPEAFEEAWILAGKPKGGTRFIAKSVVHANNYNETIKVLDPRDLQSERIRSERNAGALLVFDGREGRRKWEFRGGIVCYTGKNLAERMFGAATFELRKKALALSQHYWSMVPEVKDWHYDLSKMVEDMNGVRSHTGRYLELYGTNEEDLKIAAAFCGQGTGADRCQVAMIDKWKQTGEIPVSQIHDALLYEVPREWSDARCKEFINFMQEPSEKFPGLYTPIKTTRGDNWEEMREI